MGSHLLLTDQRRPRPAWRCNSDFAEAIVLLGHAELRGLRAGDAFRRDAHALYRRIQGDDEALDRMNVLA